MSTTAKAHFDMDIDRASGLVRVASNLPVTKDAERRVRDDVLRSAWMFAVGAMDAYFCDAYVSLLARILRGKQRSAETSGAWRRRHPHQRQGRLRELETGTRSRTQSDSERRGPHVGSTPITC
jgi:hypothetical protein